MKTSTKRLGYLLITPVVALFMVLLVSWFANMNEMPAGSEQIGIVGKIILPGS